MIVDCAVYCDGKRKGGHLALEDAFEAGRSEDSFVWIGLHEPTEELLRQVQEEFRLHDLAIEDAQHAHKRPKIESYGESLFVVMHTAQVVHGHIRFGETYAFLGPRCAVRSTMKMASPYSSSFGR